MAYKRISGLRVFQSDVAGDTPNLASIEINYIYLNTADKKMWAARYDDQTRSVASVLIAEPVTPESISVSTKTVDLAIGPEFDIPGSSFSPPITIAPSLMTAVVVGEGGATVTNVIVGYKVNGDYFDITIAEQSEETLNVKISIL